MSEEGRPATEAASELEALFVEEGEHAVDRLLREALENYAGFTRDGRLVTKPEFLRLSHQSRLLVVLLARNAAVRLGLKDACVEATAETLSEICMTPLKSSRESLSRFKAKRLLEKNERGYFVPNWALSTVVQALTQA